MEREAESIFDNEAHIDALLFTLNAAWKTIEIEMINNSDHFAHQLPALETEKQCKYTIDDVMDEEWADPSF